ncbi:Glycosyltransferase involved in cell wall bisynthesis [Mucilaginibacter pineti]|uniref:Glycosyltransferase involved in cell wall bisynthesis n=1 Tax=Mucilaginibacter pineti TaxID=1391627 RepID=A0A1G6Z156_9SPHI|nr:glycosyltransferase family 1 protein [Mucilaginibacter pineti]SDD96043.1 Glycosyltransferase involved in cell wall bisynthesis [Mucilaginibacter pineti]
MKVLLITGTYPPGSCGIGDYTEKLATALKQLQMEVEVLANLDWSITCYFKIKKRIVAINPDIIHIQYPSVGYGASLVPQLLSLQFKTFVTIHEVLQAHILRKISLLPFSIRSQVIFTNEFEKIKFQRIFPWSRLFNTTTVIPIGSNISRTDNGSAMDKNTTTIVSFGQIRPNKGLEDVLKLASLIEENKLPYTVLIVGQVLPKFQSYFQSLQNSSANILDWKINLPEEEVGRVLSNHLLSYMPFPDGVSERRGSLLAALANDMLVFTTCGQHTTAEISTLVVFASSPNDLVYQLKETGHDELLQMSQSRLPLLKKYIKKLGWGNIAKLHREWYMSGKKPVN